MDDSEDYAGYPSNPYETSYRHQGYGSVHRPVSKESVGDYDEEDDIEVQEEEEDNDELINGGELAGKDTDDTEDEGNDGELAGKDTDDTEDEGNDGEQKSYDNLNYRADMERHPTKQKLKSLVSNYEFARRVPVPPASSAPKPSSGGRNSLTDWTERETVVLLNAWGERFLRRGRKCLRSEEWQEVVVKVSEVSNIERTDTQCWNRLDTLKKKYKKEKIKFGYAGGAASKWVYFKKLDMLLSSPSQQSGLSSGLGPGKGVFMNSRVYSNHANGYEELGRSPGDSGSTDAKADGSDGLLPKKRKCGRNTGDGSSFKLLAGSIKMFGEIYENIENIRRRQMAELEKMRMDFSRELEVQNRQILQRAKAEIAKLQGDYVENDVSADDGSG